MKPEEATRIESFRLTHKTLSESWLYTIEGKPGLWQKMPREGRAGIKTPHEDRIVAYLEKEDVIIELKRAKEIELLVLNKMGCSNPEALIA